MSDSMRVRNTSLREAYDEMSKTVNSVNLQIDENWENTAEKIVTTVFSGGFICLADLIKTRLLSSAVIPIMCSLVTCRIVTDLGLEYLSKKITKSDEKFIKEMRGKFESGYRRNDIEINQALFGKDQFSQIDKDFKNGLAFQWPYGQAQVREEFRKKVLWFKKILEFFSLDKVKLRFINKIKLDSFAVVKKRYEDSLKEKPFLLRYLPRFLRVHLTSFWVMLKNLFKQ